MTDSRVYEFGDVRVDIGRMAATRGGTAIPLEPKAFDVLVYLLEHHDRLVTKDELLEAGWRDTFVTPNVLTRAIAQIRKALGEEAEDVRYIETVAKRGYRFVAPVRLHPSAPPALPPAVPLPPVETEAAVAPSGGDLKGRRAWIAGGVFALLALLAGGLALISLRSSRTDAPGSPQGPLTRLTNRRGFSGTPSLAPDGRALVYASDATGAIELYQASLTSGVADVQLTHDGGHNMQPAWSPDGQWIAYHSRKRGGVWIIPSSGGTPQQVADFGSDPAWSPDSGTIVFTSDAGGLAGQSNLWIVRRDGSGRKPLTQIGTPAGGHRAPAWSHDGRFIAFLLARGGFMLQIWIMNVATGSQELVDTTPFGADPAFTPDDRMIVWGGATGNGNGRLFQRALDADGHPSGAVDVVFPFESAVLDGVTVASNGTVVFAARSTDANLWAVDTPPTGRAGEPVRLTDDVARSTHPDYSPDGRIAYQQTSAGAAPSIWLINDDGSGKSALMPGIEAVEPEWDLPRGRILISRLNGSGGSELAWVALASRRITTVGLVDPHMFSRRLSPNADGIAFHSIEQDGRMNVWKTTFDGTRTLLASDQEAVSYPIWSPDGRWLAVELKRGDTTQVGVVSAAGGPVVPLTDARGQSWPHDWSPDSERIAFAGQRDGVWNIYAVSRVTRAVTRLTSFQSAAGYVRYPVWSPRGTRIVFERSIDTANLWTGRLPNTQPPQ